MRDLRQLAPTIGESVSSLWCRHKSLLQPPGIRRPNANRKMSDSAFYKHIYSLAIFHEDYEPNDNGEAGDASEDVGNGDDHDDGADVGGDNDSSGIDRDDGSDDGDDPPGGGGKPIPRTIGRKRSDPSVLLMRQWLLECMVAGGVSRIQER